MPNSLGWPAFAHEDHCPVCGDRIEAMSAVTDINPPQPGDPTVCVMCRSINVVGDDGYIRLPTHGEALVFLQDPDIQRIIAAMNMLGPPPRGRR